ncbi:hypothetical protein [Moraxella lacunata]
MNNFTNIKRRLNGRLFYHPLLAFCFSKQLDSHQKLPINHKNNTVYQ